MAELTKHSSSTAGTAALAAESWAFSWRRSLQLQMPQGPGRFLLPSMDLQELTNAWACRAISNLDYLLHLNKLAGRGMGNPSFHPMLPWILDMTVAPEAAMHQVQR